MKFKEFIGVVVFLVIFLILAIWGIERFEKINNGEMIVVSESEIK